MDSDLPIPPVDLRFMGKTDEQFYVDGDRLLDRIWDMASPSPSAAVLDIGSGYGRVAHALLRRSEFVGRYVGMDILPRHVAWCAEHLTPASDGRFQFHLLDVKNARYNPSGTMESTDVTFDFAGAADLVLLMSVFTHMYPDNVLHYVSEMSKVMRPGAQAIVTFFLRNDSQREGEEAGRSKYPLLYELEGTPCRYFNPDDPLHVIAYEESAVVEMMAGAGLKVTDVRLGSWCGRRGAAFGQDMILVERQG